MIDTHTHILPGMDDGAVDLEESLRMLRVSYAQGVRKVVLTPHFYPGRESVDAFLKRREQAFNALRDAWEPDMPQLILGAEVAWCAGIEHMDRIQELTVGQSQWLLLEMPYKAWSDEQFDSLWNLIQRAGVTPILAHVERFLHLQQRGQYQVVADMQIPMQLSAGVFGKWLKRRKALALLQQGQWMIGSDCHDLSQRPPCMALAQQYLQRHAPEKMAALSWNFE